MIDLKLGVVESRFADIIWKNEPLTTKELTIICEKELNWKRTTTYTVLKKLCDRGIFMTKSRIVTSLMTKAEFTAARSEQFVDENYCGSLPAFIAAFTTRKALSSEELSEIKNMIKSLEEQTK